MKRLRLREIEPSDVAVFFDQQLDVQANQMAAFGATDPTDRQGFFLRWKRILEDRSITKRTILSDERIAGHILSFGPPDEREVCYWLGREYWGQGIASHALAQFLSVARERPLLARAVQDNVASLRVLEKCGFVAFATDTGFSRARGCQVNELVVRLD